MRSLRRLLGRESPTSPVTPGKPDPVGAASHFNDALAHLDGGEYALAESRFRNALAAQPQFPEAWVGLAEALEGLGRDKEALGALDTAISQRSQFVGALCNASALLLKMGQRALAESRMNEIDLDGLFIAGRFDEAEAVARHKCSAWPEQGHAWKVLGAVLAFSKRFQDARPFLERAAALLPSDAEAHNNHGICLKHLALLEEAEKSFRRAVSLKDDYPEANRNLANTLLALGRSLEAEAACRHAIALDPASGAAHSDLGNILEAMGRHTQASDCYVRALELEPLAPLAHNNLAASLVALGRVEEAVESSLRALELFPAYTEGHDNLLFLLNYHPDKSASEVFSAYRNYDALIGQPLISHFRPCRQERRPDARLRVGYVSPDFRRHAVSYFVEPLLEHHDRSNFEIYAYSQASREDEVSAKLKSLADCWVPTWQLDDLQLTERIRADRIDILVDLAGHTRGNRLTVFARKPAPVSVTTIGYGYTTGLSAVDWILTDAVMAPPGSEHLFSEKPWRLPLSQVYRPAEGMGPVAPLPATDRGFLTFGSLTRAARLNHRVIRVWSQILRKAPGSRLKIDSLNFRDEALCARIRGLFATHGVDAHRLDLGYHSPPWDVMNSIDITLDCFPQNSGTTLFESLYMGIPFITLADRPSLGRLGSSIARNVGHAAWVAETEQEYIEKAVTMGSRLDKLGEIRGQLRQAMQASPLMDESGYVRKVESAYREMWRLWCAS